VVTFEKRGSWLAYMLMDKIVACDSKWEFHGLTCCARCSALVTSSEMILRDPGTEAACFHHLSPAVLDLLLDVCLKMACLNLETLDHLSNTALRCFGQAALLSSAVTVRQKAYYQSKEQHVSVRCKLFVRK
jgi:hypothetical protein